MMRAHAPGSLTGLYAPAPADDPDGISRGASVAVEAGVTVDVTAAEETSISVDGEPTAFDPVEGVLDALGVRATVAVEPEAPLGAGFGASGAATLATALAANERFGLGRDRESLLQAAHRAELDAGTGQGDVFIQDRGGLLWSDGEGINRRKSGAAIEYESAGGIDTGEVLADEAFAASARAVGPPHFAALGNEPTVRTFVERSWDYVSEIGLATPFVEDRVETVGAAGGAASMALFGDTVFAVDGDGSLPKRTAVSNRGAHVLDD